MTEIPPPLAEIVDEATLASMTKRERRRWEKALRWQRRIARYEAKRQGPQPKAAPHRVIITLLMMAALLFLLYLLLFTNPSTMG